MQGFSHWKGEVDDHEVMSHSLCLCRGLGDIKGECTEALRLLSGFLVAVHSVTLSEELQTLSCGYLSTSWGVRFVKVQNMKCNKMCGWYIILCQFLDNSGSPSIVEQ